MRAYKRYFEKIVTRNIFFSPRISWFFGARALIFFNFFFLFLFREKNYRRFGKEQDEITMMWLSLRNREKSPFWYVKIANVLNGFKFKFSMISRRKKICAQINKNAFPNFFLILVVLVWRSCVRVQGHV